MLVKAQSTLDGRHTAPTRTVRAVLVKLGLRDGVQGVILAYETGFAYPR
jgi:hypothetical protein